MNWQAIGAIADTLGAVAIFISLIYVAIQIRQNTLQMSQGAAATRLAAFETNIESGNRIRELLVLHQDLADLMLKGTQSYQELDRSEKFRFGLLLRNIFSAMQGAYIRQLSTEHDPEAFAGSVRVIDELLVNKGVQEWLAKNKPDWRSEFAQCVDERLKIVTQKAPAA